MKRGSLLLAPASILLGLSACATGGGAGAGGLYTDCFNDYCVEYDGLNAQRLYLRTPAGPATGRRGDVKTADRRAGTQVVTREPAMPASARMAPIPARSSGPGRSGGRQP